MIERIRAWAARHAAEGRYSPVGQIFHWVMAALISFQLYWGWHMGDIAPGAGKMRAYQVHAELGMLMLLLAALRFVWRTIIPGPVNDADRLGWQTTAAYVTHGLFYICFFGLPLSGWLMWSALGEGQPLSIAGIVPVPPMPTRDIAPSLQWMILDWAQDIHVILVALLVLMIPAHVGAALKHHFWDKHDVLRGMLPELDADEAKEKPRHGLPQPRSRRAKARG